MPKSKYKFNPESLSFDKVKLGFRAVLLRGLAYLVGSLLIAIVYYMIFAIFFDSPKEKALLREIDQLTLQYDLIHREMNDLDKVITHLQETDDNLYRTIFEAEPIPSTLREGGEGGVNRYKELEGYNNSSIVIETTKRLDKIRKQVYLQSKSFDELIELAKRKEDMLKAVPAILPISNKDLKRTASGYGLRIHPIYKIIKFHAGMDFTAPTGTDIYATGDATVKAVVSAKRGLGNHVILDHGFGYESIYAHMDKANVRVGQKVSRGDIIGFVGNTGTSVAPHLHYEIKLNGNNVDPVNYYFNDLSPEEYEEMIEIASKTGQSFD
ncbi:MAG TPA: M23 family metallopeptidase [Bacteroidales bacterium]|jgi:murein DD-endopeptidase MepM/ murein hydrolase activator NlpD|nr:peptidoglycan DD-metalloendopeptidase family protein [Bacteroidales bacterium]OQB60927.1 MAG: Murein DD-endopeptidase MepM [Bacteroidetes bacterium ADurb.Bin145]NMD02174.1 M23 family metallopeptidase [Bacteroidales bacterium]HOU02382.1 M23 family metallopeptidase [Bacteroidales bacterium]HQG63123.1 M23 family metallopeptidase [Bacteroidales bacterium]